MRDMRLEWIEGPARFVVANYDEDTATFTPTAAASGLITLSYTPDFELTFVEGGLGLIAFDTTLHAEGFIAQGSTGDMSNPRIEFWVDRQRVATLTSGGVLITPNITEETAVPGEGLFELDLGGSLFATIGRAGLVCPAIEEP